MSGPRAVNPPGWPQPKGFSNGIVARGTQVFVAGQIGWNAQCKFESDEFAPQFRQALANTVAVLAAAGAEPAHIVRMTIFVTDKRQYLASLREVGAAWRDIIGRNFPAMTLVEVTALLEDRARVEIETTAVIPDGPGA